MSSPSRERVSRLLLIALCVALLVATATTADPAPPTQPTTQRVLRITADPNNLPFSNDRGEGFENKIAELIAKDLNATIEYHWRAQRRGFFRDSLKANECDLVLGVPAGFERALPTRPYYRSSYVFVSRADRNLSIASLDDPKLRGLKIGVQLVGDDYENTPPVHALGTRGIVNNVVGYSLYADYRQPNPTARIMKAVAAGDVDVAIVWGPLAGYFATREAVPLAIAPLSPEVDADGMPFTFAIAMGARKGDTALRNELNTVIEKRQREIDAILDAFGVPRLPIEEAKEAPAAEKP